MSVRDIVFSLELIDSGLTERSSPSEDDMEQEENVLGRVKRTALLGPCYCPIFVRIFRKVLSCVCPDFIRIFVRCLSVRIFLSLSAELWS